MKIKIKELKELVFDILIQKYSEEDSNIIMEALLFGELSGNTSHGIVRLTQGYTSMMAQKPTGPMTIKKRTELSHIIEAKRNPAILAMYKAVELVTKGAQQYGFSIAGTNSTISTSGCLSFYLKYIAEKDLVGLLFARSDPHLAPFGAKRGLFGTNPIGFAIPSEGIPLIFDMGSTGISYGEVLRCDSEEELLPPDTALDKEGRPTRNPKEVINGGSLLPFRNSYKSSGIAMIVEILGGILPQAGFMFNGEENWGNTVMAFKPDLLIEKDEFKKKVEKLKEELKNEKDLSGSPLRIPGENTLKNFYKNSTLEEIEVDDHILENLKNYKKEEL